MELILTLKPTYLSYSLLTHGNTLELVPDNFVTATNGTVAVQTGYGWQVY